MYVVARCGMRYVVYLNAYILYYIENNINNNIIFHNSNLSINMYKKKLIFY